MATASEESYEQKRLCYPTDPSFGDSATRISFIGDRGLEALSVSRGIVL